MDVYFDLKRLLITYKKHNTIWDKDIKNNLIASLSTIKKLWKPK